MHLVLGVPGVTCAERGKSSWPERWWWAKTLTSRITILLDADGWFIGWRTDPGQPWRSAASCLALTPAPRRCAESVAWPAGSSHPGPIYAH